MERRHAGLREMMDRHDLGAVIIVGAAGPLETSVQFYTNWPPLVESYVVATPNGDMTLFVRLWNHLPDAERTATLEDVQYGGDTPVEQAHTVANALARAVAKDARIGIIGPLRYADALILQETLRNVTCVDLSLDYRAFRLIKSDEELAYTRLAASFNDDAVAAMKKQIKPGINEREIAQIIEDVYLSQGAVNQIHFTLSTPMESPEFPVPHQLHPDRTIQSGDVI